MIDHSRRRARGGTLVAAGIALVLGLAACVSPTSESPAVTVEPSPPAVTTAPLTSEEAALQDLRGCLAVNDVLNVFYLLDDSGSLRDTDPNSLRQGILADSLESLSNLAPSERVNWAAGSFKSEFRSLVDWSPLDAEKDPGELSGAIPPTEDGWTNWEAGIRGAQLSLETQAAGAPGCSLLIWFTDGAIDLSDGPNGPLTTAAFDALCAGSPGQAGLLQQLRASQIVVFGVLLNEEDGAAASEKLTRVVEGSSTDAQGVVQRCGSISSTDVRGTVKVVAAVGDLAEVFDQLPILLAGGSRGDIADATGEFDVPIGVSRFVIRFADGSETWTLSTPDGELITRGGLDIPDGVTVSEPVGDSSSVEVLLDRAYEEGPFTGTWTVVDHEPGNASLFRFSDLTVSVDLLSGGNFGVVSGEGSTITGTIVDRDGNPAALSLYEYDWIIQERLAGEELPRELPNETSDSAGATFTIDFGATSAQPGDEPVVDISLVNLRTVDGGVPLEGPIASLRLTVLDADQVPGNLRIEFTEPAGSATAPARGEIIGQSPAGGGTVAIVVRDSAPLVINDRFDRQFVIQADSSDCEAGITICGVFSPAQTAVPLELGISTSDEPQYSNVTGELLIELAVPANRDGSDVPVRLIRTVPFSLETERPINLALLVGLLLALLAIGLAIPFALAWALKRALVWYQHGRLLQRAEFPVLIKGGGLALTGVDPSDEPSVASMFRNLAPNDRVRTHTDARLGTFAVRVPLNPLESAWFSLTPSSGTRVIAKQTGVAPRKYSTRLAEGALVSTNGVLSSVWGVAVDERDLHATDVDQALPGFLIVYFQPVLGESGQYGKRLLEIITTTDWRARARELVHAVSSTLPGSSDAVLTPAASGDVPPRPDRSVSTSDQRSASNETLQRPPGRSASTGPVSPSRSESNPPRTRGDDSSPPTPRPPGR